MEEFAEGRHGNRTVAKVGQGTVTEGTLAGSKRKFLKDGFGTQSGDQN